MIQPRGSISLVAPAAEDTERYGALLAPVLKPGDTVLLSGDLGTGKTTFTQGLARSLGVEGPVTSPTFVLVHSYRTKAGWDLLHADVWRLEQLQEVIDLAIPELVEEGAAAVIEWGERAAPALSADCLHVTIEFADAGRRGRGRGRGGGEHGGAGEAGAVWPAGPEGPRRLLVYAGGPSWEGRLRELSTRLAEAGNV
jgi:tRNA threonylcarbamoyladenosine biosynthesis protein TsaE